MKLIVGLGNPGKRYEKTRHNIGFLVADSIASQSKWSFKGGKGPYEVANGSIGGIDVLLSKPATFMNESGRALSDLCGRYNILPQDCLVVIDEINLPLGKIRYRSKGSSGGHHGLESIVAALGTSDFHRLRIGIGPDEATAGKDISDFVLSSFNKAEWEALVPQIEKAKQACLDWLTEPPETVMQRYNA